jgi:hypothetical protein
VGLFGGCEGTGTLLFTGEFELLASKHKKLKKMQNSQEAVMTDQEGGHDHLWICVA